MSSSSRRRRTSASNKTPRLTVFNNNNEKHKLLKRNVPFKHQVELSPTAIANGAIKRNPFEKKSKRGTTNRVCNDKLLHKLVKLHLNLKVNKSKLRETILRVKDIITLDPNTMKSNATTS